MGMFVHLLGLTRLVTLWAGIFSSFMLVDKLNCSDRGGGGKGGLSELSEKLRSSFWEKRCIAWGYVKYSLSLTFLQHAFTHHLFTKRLVVIKTFCLFAFCALMLLVWKGIQPVVPYKDCHNNSQKLTYGAGLTWCNSGKWAR